MRVMLNGAHRTTLSTEGGREALERLCALRIEPKHSWNSYLPIGEFPFRN